MSLRWVWLWLPVCIVAAWSAGARASGGAPSPMGVGIYSPSEFKFVTIVADSGRGTVGGWQEAIAQLRVVDARHVVPRIWSCRVTVGMPIRATLVGHVSPERAAEIAARVATDASPAVMHRQSEWLTAAYCEALFAEMKRIFRLEHKNLGARVNGGT